MSKVQENYDDISAEYDNIESLPHSKLCQELVLHALGDCAGQTILDLGGGSGLHSRNALTKGVASVHNVDLSPEMLENCAAAEQKAGRKPGDKIVCIVGDATKPLELPGDALYDVILMLWTFDLASTNADLESMWRNVSKHCRPGGKLISIRSTDPRTRPQNLAKYGVVPSNFEDVEGGVRYDFKVGFDKPFTVRATNMEANFNLELSRAMAKKHGFNHLEVLPVAEMPVVKADPDFWKEFLAHNVFICVTGTKSAD